MPAGRHETLAVSGWHSNPVIILTMLISFGQYVLGYVKQLYQIRLLMSLSPFRYEQTLFFLKCRNIFGLNK
jgi:hypothetical protein